PLCIVAYRNAPDRTCGTDEEPQNVGAHRTYRERKFAFGKHILSFRTRASLTQSALAEHVGVHLRSVQNWEAGESYPKAETLQRLIAVLLGFHAFTHDAE